MPKTKAEQAKKPVTKTKPKRTRVLTGLNILDKVFHVFEFTGLYRQIFDTPERHGWWIIYGEEKNGKTTVALNLADYLSKFDKVLYMSAEEGISKHFAATYKRIGINPRNKNLHFVDEIPIDELIKKANLRKGHKIIFIDNITVYADLKYNGLDKLRKECPNTLFVFLAHEEKGAPYTSTAKSVKRLSQVIIRVQGLTAFVSGRVKGGSIVIDEKSAKLYHGNAITKQQSDA